MTNTIPAGAQSDNSRVIPAAFAPLDLRDRPWTVHLSIWFFMLSAIRFVNRDALGRDVGWQGFLQFGCVMLGALLCGGILWRRKEVMRIDAYLFTMAGFTCFALASASRSYWPPLSVIKALAFLAVVYTAAGSAARIGSQKILRSMYFALLATICVGLVLGAAGVFPFFEMDDYSGRTRFSLFVLHPGVVADFTAFAVLTGRLLPRKPPIWLEIILVAMNVLTSAKGATIGLLAALFVSVAPWKGLNVRRLAAGALALSVILAVLLIAINTTDIAAVSDGPIQTLYGNNLKEEVFTVNGRVELWKTVIPLIENSLGLGFGLDGAREVLLDAFDWSGNSHNAVLEVMLAAGLPGALLFLTGWAIALGRAARLSPEWRHRVMAVHVYLIITSFASPIWTTSQYISVFFLTLMNATARELLAPPEPDRPRRFSLLFRRSAHVRIATQEGNA